MYCIILAAGLGTRMGELTEKCPKPMLLIKGKPKLAYSIDALPQSISDVVVIVNYLGDQIIDYFGVYYGGRNMHYITQKELNGTAGAVMSAKGIVGGKFLVIMGDDLYRCRDLERMMQYDMALLAYRTNSAEQFGLVDVDDEQNLISVVERPHERNFGLINTGAYIINDIFFESELIKISHTEYGLPQALVSLYPEIKTKVLVTDTWQSMGNPRDLAIVQKRIDEFIA